MKNEVFHQCKDHDSISASQFVKVGHDLQQQGVKERGSTRGNIISFSKIPSATSSLTFLEDNISSQHQHFMNREPVVREDSKGETSLQKADRGGVQILPCDKITRLFQKEETAVRILSALIAICLPYLAYLIIQVIEKERTLVLFETKFGCMAVRSIATLVDCAPREEGGRHLCDWYE